VPTKQAQGSPAPEKARTYPPPAGADPGDALLNIPAIIAEFGVNYWTFIERQAEGWRSLGGGRLTPHKRLWGKPGEEPPRRPEKTFLRSEVAIALLPPTDPGRYEMPDGTVRYSLDRARAELSGAETPVARETLKKYAKEGLITFRWWQSPQTGLWEQWCSAEGPQGLESLKAKVRARREATERNGPDGPQILLSSVMPELRRLWRQHFGRAGRNRQLVAKRVLRWGAKGCPYLGGRRLTLYRRKGCPSWILKADYEELVRALGLPRGHYLIDGVVHVGKTQARARKKLRAGQLTRLLNGENAKVLGQRGVQGSPRRVVPLADLDCPPAGPPRFTGCWPDGRISLALASQKYNIPYPSLRKYARKGRLAAEKRSLPGVRGHSKPEYAVLPADVRQLKARLLASRPRDNWKTAGEIANLCQAKGPEERIRIWSLLRQGRESGRLRFRLPDLPLPVGGRRLGRPPFQYDAEEALRFIASAEPGATTQADALADITQGADASQPSSTSPGTRTHRGRRPSPLTEEVYRVCYELYLQVLSGEHKMRWALKEAQRRLEGRAPREETHLRLYANRYASRSGKPLPARN
jgi:hypothetical protein